MKRIILHVGAHRAGSSTLQGMLVRRRDELSRAGVTAWTRTDLRRPLLLRQLLAMHRAGARGLAAAWPLSRAPGGTLVVSDENLLGTMPGHRGAAFYPGHASALEGIRALGRLFDLGVRWILRRQDRFLESVYAFRVGRGLVDDFASFARPIAHALHWLPIARAAARAGEIRIAIFESLFPRGSEADLGRFVGLFPTSDWEVPLRRGNVGLRGPVIHVMRHLNAHAPPLDADERRLTVDALARIGGDALPSREAILEALSARRWAPLEAEIARAHAFASREPHAGFDPDARRAFLARYEADNRTLLGMKEVEGDAAQWV